MIKKLFFTISFLFFIPALCMAATDTRVPTGDEGFTGSWTAKSGGSYYVEVAAAGEPDDDTSYIYCTAVGRITFNFSSFSIPTGSTISNVNVYWRHKKTSAAACKIGPVLKVGGNYYTGTEASPANNVWNTSNSITVGSQWTQNPKTSSAWTVDDVNGGGSNALQAFGVSSTDASPNPYCTQVYIEVNYTPPAYMNLTQVEVTQATTSNIYRGSTDNPILRLRFITTGSVNPTVVTGIQVAEQCININDLDSTTGDAKLYWTGSSSSFATSNQIGSTLDFALEGDTITFSGLSQTLSEGNNYIWLTFDIDSNATVGNTVDAKIPSGGISVSSDDTPGFTETTFNPDGSRTIASAPDLTPSEGSDYFEFDTGGTTVDDFRIRFTEWKGGTIEKWFDKYDSDSEDKLQPSTNSWALTLFNEQAGYDGNYYHLQNDKWPTQFELIEVTPTRAKVYVEGTIRRYISDDDRPAIPNTTFKHIFTVYPIGRIGLHQQRNTTAGISLTTETKELMAVVPRNFITFGQNDPTPLDTSGQCLDWIALSSNNTPNNRFADAYLALFTDWADVDYTFEGGDGVDYTNAVWRADTVNWGVGTADFYFMLGIKPNTMNAYNDPNITQRAGEYRNWDTSLESSITYGSGWRELGSDVYNEAELCYTLNIDTATQKVKFDIHGSGSQPLFQPPFKIRQYRSLNVPSEGEVKKDGISLNPSGDYNCDVKPFSLAYFEDSPTYTQLAKGGSLSSSNEYLARSDNDYQFVFDEVDDYFYLGSDSQFLGVNIDLETPGEGDAQLQWQYWNGSSWSNLSVSESASGVKDLKADGFIYWTASGVSDWGKTSVNNSPNLYYVRAYKSSNSYTTYPTENLIKTDMLLFQYLGNPVSSTANFEIQGVIIDTTPPAGITNLSALTGDNEGEVKLSWSAPGDDGWNGTISTGTYRIDFSTDSNHSWSYGNYEREISTHNVNPHDSQFYVVNGLTGGDTYYFRIWTADEVPNWSGISNGATTWAQVSVTEDTNSPAAITDLTGLCDSDTGEVTLYWSTPGDDGWNNTLPDKSGYRIDYSTYSKQWNKDNYELWIPTSGVAPHTQVSRTITGLTGDTTWYFQIWTRDEVPNWSGLSNGTTVWVNPILSVSISTDTYNFGEVPLGNSTHTVSVITVTNDGNIKETYSLKISSVTLYDDSPSLWKSTDTTTGHNRFIFYAIFHGVQVSTSNFDSDDYVIDENRTSTADWFSDNDGGGDKQTGINVPKGDDRKLWFRLDMPTSTTTSKEEKIKLTITAGPE